MDKVINFLLGVMLSVFGLALFLSNVTITNNSGGLFQQISGMLMGNSSEAPGASGILIVGVAVMFLIMCIRVNVITVGLFVLSLLVAMFSMVSSMKIQVADFSGLDIAIIMGLFISGIGLAINSMVAFNVSEKNAY